MPRKIAIGLSVAFGAVVIALLTLVLGGTKAGVYILDYHEQSLFRDVYPFTIQNVMHLVFFGTMGDLLFQWQRVRREHSLIEQQLLPESDEVVLQKTDLLELRKKVVGLFDEDSGVVPSLIDLCILRFQASASVAQVATVLTSALELCSQKVELRYTLTRYAAWLLPTVGFIGTVVGIGETLAGVDPDAPDLGLLTKTLSVAFSTTLVALVLSVMLVLAQNWVQDQDELAVNRAGRYTLKNLVNRLYAGES